MESLTLPYTIRETRRTLGMSESDFADAFGIGTKYLKSMEVGIGQTVGKKIVGIRVVADGGGEPDSRAIVLRTLLRIVDGFFFYLVGFIVAMASDKNQRLGDMVGGTRVIDA